MVFSVFYLFTLSVVVHSINKSRVVYNDLLPIFMTHITSKFIESAFSSDRDIEKIRDGIAEKVSQFLWLIMGFIICVTLSFIYGWELSLVVISYVPIVMITNTIIGKVC